MATSWLRRILNRLFGARKRRQPLRRGFVPIVENLNERILPTVTAAFYPGGVLQVFGDNNANTIVVSRDAAG